MSDILKPVKANFLHECSDVFIFMNASHIESELAVFLAALPMQDAVPMIHLERHALIEASSAVADLAFLMPPNVGELKDALSHIDDNQIQLIQCRLLQVRKAILSAKYFHGKDFESTDVFAVSPVWSKRWDQLVCGNLFPAYIGYVDIDSFQP